MAKIYVKIVGAEGDSVLVKFASDNSAKPIDEYDAIAYQPKLMGYTNPDDFISGITPNLIKVVAIRDAAEANAANPSDWVDHSTVFDIPKTEPVVPFNPVYALDTSEEVIL